LGSNISALEVDGNFDDCQRLVKSAFLNKNLRKKIQLSSANSINIARLLPQSAYYHWAMKEIGIKSSVIFSVPSGNFGNLTGGLIAKKMGLPVEKFIASTNVNDVVPDYLKTGIINPKPSVHTISNAMDVGNPSNLDRIISLYGYDIEKIRSDITGSSFTDNETIETIQTVFSESNYIMEPHTAVGYSGLLAYQKLIHRQEVGIVLSTAHPAKFPESIEGAIRQKVPIPKEIRDCFHKEMKKISISKQEENLSEILLSV